MNGNSNEVIHIKDEKASIKIEKDTSDEGRCKMIKENSNGTNGTNGCTRVYVDAASQTDNVDLIAALKRLVKDRIRQYQDAFIKEEVVNKRIDPSLLQLHRENVELKKELQSLRVKVENIERRGVKRQREVLSPSQSRREIRTTVSPINVSRSPQQVLNNKTENAHLQIKSQRFIKQPGSNMPLHRPPQSGIVHHRHGAPVQMVAPVQQMSSPHALQRHPYAIGEQRVVFVDEHNQIIGGNLTGVNTQVVAANQGLRMTALTPNVQQIQRLPINVQPNAVSNIQQNSFSNYQYSNVHRLPSPSTNVTIHKKIMQSPPNMRRIPQQPYPPIALKPNIQENNATQNIPTQPKLPKLKASISASGNGIILTWDCEQSGTNQETHRKVECYHLFAHQAKDNRVIPPTDIKQWKKIGVVNALPLPMACTLTQFATGNVYFFAVLAVDIHGRESEMSNPCIIRLNLDS